MKQFAPHSSVRGCIKILLMAYSNSRDTAQVSRIRAVRRMLRRETSLLVWCNSEKDRDYLWEQLQSDHLEIKKGSITPNSSLSFPFYCYLVSPEGKVENYSHWVRDPIFFSANGNGSINLRSSHGAKVEDQTWAKLYWDGLKIGDSLLSTNGQSMLPVAGGNILFDEDFIIIGFHQYKGAAINGNGIHPDLKTLNVFGKPGTFKRLIKIGKHAVREPTRLPHVDLYIALTGHRNPKTGKYVVLLSKAYLLKNGNDRNPNIRTIITGINRYLNIVEKELLEYDFEVVRTPLPMVEKETIGDSYLCYYNNCILEKTNELNTVWIPQYSYSMENVFAYKNLVNAERKIRKIWQSLGFEVKFIDADFHSIADEHGALHCLTQEISRS